MGDSVLRPVPFELSEGDLERLHEATMAILADPGVRFTQEAALAVFREAGYTVEGDVVLSHLITVAPDVEGKPFAVEGEGIKSFFVQRKGAFRDQHSQSESH